MTALPGDLRDALDRMHSRSGRTNLPKSGLRAKSALVLGDCGLPHHVIAVLVHLAPVLGDAPSGPTVRRALDLGHRQLGQGGAAPTWKKGYDHPLGAWLANTREPLAMLLRPGNAGPDTFTDHREVLAAAIRQVPARFRNKLLIRVDGAGASHELVKHLLSLSSARRIVLFTSGWMITAAGEDAIRQVPADAWKPGTGQDGSAEDGRLEVLHHLHETSPVPG